MDGKQYSSRLNAIGTNVERTRQYADRLKDNPFIFRDSSVDPVNTGTTDKVNRFISPRYMAMEKQSLVTSEQMTPSEFEMQYMEQSERMEKKLQQSMMLLNHKQQMQQKILLMQQQQIQQQRQVQLQHQNQQLQQPQLIVQQRMLRQRSPEKQRQDSNVDSQVGHQKLEHNHTEDLQKTQCPEFSDSSISVQDLFAQCQSHLDVINACTDLQQTIKDEMKKQAKLDNIICQKLVSKAQRLQQQATFLEKAHAPGWVGPALLDLGSQVTQQAEVHHIYTATLIEQCVVIQHSLDGHHELMKSVLAEHSESKQKSVSQAERGNKGITSVADKRSPLKAGDETRSMTFLQASNIFEDIRKPRMKLLSCLEYRQDQLNATVMHLDQVNAEIEAISNKEDSEGLMWRRQLQKKDLEIRKEFLEARKEQLESDVQFAKMDLTDFELNNKDSLMEVLNVFCQHRIRYDTTLRHSFQLLQAATMRDINYLRRLTKKSDLDSSTEFESGDIYEGLNSTLNDPWECASKFAAKMISVTIPSDNDRNSTTFVKSTSPQISTKRSPHLPRNPQEQIDTKIPTIEQTYPIVLSSDSEMSDVQKSSMYSPELKPVKMPTVNSYNVGQFQNMSDFNFSRAESSPSLTEINDGVAALTDASDMTKSSNWHTVNEKLNSFMENRLHSTNDDGKLIISRYVDDINVSEKKPLKSNFHCGTEDMLVVTRGPKPRHTLGNFENSLESECSVHCLYPMTSVRESTRNREEKRVTHLINKYASGGRGSRSSLGKNWNSCKPMLWCGISKSLVRDKDSRRKMNRSLKYCKLLTQHNILTEYNENKHRSFVEPTMRHLEGKNTNNSEILHGQGDQERTVCSKPSPKQKVTVKSERDCNGSMVDGCNSHTSSGCHSEYQRQDQLCCCELAADVFTGKDEKLVGSVGEDFKDDTTNNQSLCLVKNNGELLTGQESRNLNNCEPLKCQVVNAEVLPEREDQMDFGAVQAVCPDSQPRQVRVCAVRPIPSEVDRGGSGQTVAKDITGGGSEGTQPRRGLSCKYDKLKVYEITAGQFTVSELGTYTKSRSTLKGNMVDCSNNKHPDFTHFNSHDFSNLDCLNKSNLASRKNPVCESRPQDDVNTKTGRKSSLPNYEWFSTAKSSKGSCNNVNSDSTACHGAFCTEQVSCVKDARTATNRAEAEVGATSSGSDQSTQGTKEMQEMSSNEFGNLENLEKKPVRMNDPPKKDKCDDKFDEEETLSKTLYHPEEKESNVKLCGGDETHCKPKDTSSIIDKNIFRECSYDKLVESGEVTNTNRQPPRNIPEQMATIQTTRSISSQRLEASKDSDEIKYKGIEMLLEKKWSCAYEIHTESKGEMKTTETSESSTNQTFSKSKTGMSNFTSKRENSQTNVSEEPTKDEIHSLRQYNQDYSRKLQNKESLKETKECRDNTQQEKQNRPLKSSLKKHCSSYSVRLEISSETKEDCKYFPLCGVPSLGGTNPTQVPHQADIDKIYKCVKQVRFDPRVHYDDNTVMETLDATTTSQESAPEMPCSANTNTNCTDCSENIRVVNY
ncbi:unnamed protein product [Candidula unifasciata]|uniref:Uncharacterized protein n=1 Tax=Candidula unifasciata TaxID=100452 RepID=A0A8S3YG83_9EUPU|nr:unnamed protein product [Candidula unifasciata]